MPAFPFLSIFFLILDITPGLSGVGGLGSSSAY